MSQPPGLILNHHKNNTGYHTYRFWIPELMDRIVKAANSPHLVLLPFLLVVLPVYINMQFQYMMNDDLLRELSLYIANQSCIYSTKHSGYPVSMKCLAYLACTKFQSKFFNSRCLLFRCLNSQKFQIIYSTHFVVRQFGQLHNIHRAEKIISGTSLTHNYT